MTISTAVANCQLMLRATGKPYPRTCEECGLGPCKYSVWSKPAQPNPSTHYVQTGWLCPACGRGNAPTNMTCPCKPWPEMRVTC
jgi:hypothetical protein